MSICVNFQERKAMPQIGYNEAGQPIGAAEWNRMQQQSNPGLFKRIGQGLSKAASSVGNAVSNAGQSTGFLGTPGHFEYNARFPEHIQKPFEQYYTGALNRLNEGLQNPAGPNPAIDPILKQAEMDYYTKTLPALSESYTSLGNQRSAGFPAAVTGSGQQFSTNLAALKAQYGLQERGQLMNALQQSPYENTFQPPTQGWGPQALQLGLDVGAAYLNPVSAIGSAAVRGYQAFRGSGNSVVPGAGQQQSFMPQQQQQAQFQPQQQEWLSGFGQRAAQPGYRYSPEDIQQLQSILGGQGAASDFAKTFGQPQAKRITFPRSPQDQARYAGLIKSGVI